MGGADNAANVAGLLTRVTAAEGGQAHARQQTPGQESSFLDVWTHSYDGLSDRLGEVASDPTTLVTSRLDLLQAVGTGLAAGGAGTTHSEAVDSMAAQMDGLGDSLSAIGDAQGALATIGATFAFLTSIEQMLSTAFAMIPFPAFPALRITDFDVGLPHAHNHPPNLTPPNPVPVPLPSVGPVIPIPIFSGAMKTLINGMPAARCGDMGLGIWCGGYFPMYEVFLGSSSVWIEGARASRLAVDITKHCIFTSPKPLDPPIGPMVGFTTMASTNVLIGGVPMPSLLSLALGAAFKALFKGLGKAVQAVRALRAAEEVAEGASRIGAARSSARLRNWIRQLIQKPRAGSVPPITAQARQLVDDMLTGQILRLRPHDLADEIAMMDDLYIMASTRTGREVLERVRDSGKKVNIESLPPGQSPGGAHCEYRPRQDATSRVVQDPATGGYSTLRGGGADSTVRYRPGEHAAPSTPSDAVLNHEMGHAQHAAEGNIPDPSDPTHQLPDRAAERRWSNLEEVETIEGVDNPYRAERGLTPRSGHDDLP
jgi:uncharacterized Zn-binding protein involved in type VI secretion